MLGSLSCCFRVFLLKHAEQAVLARLDVALSFLGALHSAIENGHQLRTPSEGIHRPAFDQRLEHSFVEQTKVDVLAEFVNRFELAKLLSSGDD